ncbi:MAG: tetratricopeptide repeat protein [Gammaproteobacteria bacterium]|nr:tetratricopeptide repeat protein [Gammaproteobacteria bacterium]
MRRWVATVIAALWLNGCSWMPFGGHEPVVSRGDDIASVINALPDLEVLEVAAAKPTRAEVMEAYNRVYGLITDPTQNHAVGKRLADLNMDIGEEQDIAGGDDPYGHAVEIYETLLDNAVGEGKDEIIYQLARAYDIVGRTDQAVEYLNRLIREYPDSVYIGEARFRRGEIAFSREDYRTASADYGYVARLGDATPYWQIAHYMLGWAEFKRSNLEAGLVSFFTVIDDILKQGEAESLPTTVKELLNDSFRVVTLALGYLDGPQTLADQMAARSRPHWQYLAYQKLADDYLKKERFLDSVATWQMFIEHNGLDPRAPAAHTGMIRTLVQADFPSEIRPKKEEFITRYGIYSEFWAAHTKAVREGYIDTLKVYLAEISKLAHNDAQSVEKQGRERRAAYLEAADWYEQMVVTFPADPQVVEYLFLLGEAYTEADEHGLAVTAYQRVVREYPNFESANEAGYAAILGLGQLMVSASKADVEHLQRRQIDAQVEFSLLFPADARAPSAQTDAANSLFAMNDYRGAVDLAKSVLVTWPTVDAPLRKTALLIIGHGRFELEDYVVAEDAYHQLLAVSLEPDEAEKVRERLLAAVYKQGEAEELVGSVDAAVYHYLRIRDLDGESKLAAQGHFDAVAVVEKSGRTVEAAKLLDDFRTRYPGHELAKDISMRLAAMYEQSENWSAAALEYVGIAASNADGEVRRQSLYRAAELYLAMADTGHALQYFRDYAHTYMRPMDLRMEAMHHLDELYQQTGDGDERRFWLQKKIELHTSMGKQADRRATYLAASAQFVFAEDERARFDAVHLTRPLKSSLKQKHLALKRTVAVMERVAQYQVEEFSTASTFHIADLYTALSREIIASERPGGLTELELEQYEILLEEQAFPFEEQAISLHEINMRRSWDGVYDDWVQKSFAELRSLMPARFDKQEIQVAYVENIH